MANNPLATRLCGIDLRNPVLVASGTYGSGYEAAEHGADLSLLGGVVTKSVTTQRRRGNPAPRIFETTGGMLNSIGIMNPGLEGFLADTMPKLAALPCARIVNVAGESEEDFVRLVGAFSEIEGVDALELNVSCPNVSGGLDFGIDPALLEKLLRNVRQASQTQLPIIAKLTPNITDITAVARAAEAGGADGLALINTLTGMAINWRQRVPELGSGTGFGGLSGPAIKPIALAAVHRVHNAVSIPLIGIGGITSAEDIMEFIVTGATAVQVGTTNFRSPHAAMNLVSDLQELMAQEKVGDLSEIRGTLSAPRSAHA